MYRRVAQRLTPRPAISLIICAALLSIPNVPLLVTGAAQNQPQAPYDKAKPKPGKPDGVWPDLNKVKEQSQVEREPVPPIPSTIRSPKNPLQPWNGRRVGDPGTHRDLGQGAAAGNNKVVAEGIDKLSARLRHSRVRTICPRRIDAD